MNMLQSKNNMSILFGINLHNRFIYDLYIFAQYKYMPILTIYYTIHYYLK